MIHLYFTLGIITSFFYFASSDPQTDFIRSYCNANYDATDLPAFNASRRATFADIRAELSPTKRFVTVERARSSEPLYGIFQCRPYLSYEDCMACFDAVSSLAVRTCGIKRDSTTFADGCFFRYDYANVFALVKNPGQTGFCDEPSGAEAGEGFATAALSALDVVVKIVQRDESLFAAGRKAVGAGGLVVYAVGQCIPTVQDCGSCLQSALENVEGCLPGAGGRAVEYGCFLRFSGREFFNGSQAFDLDQAMVRSGSVEGLTVLRGPTTYTYNNLKSATRNFHEKNKLGQGGFSTVYKGVLGSGRFVAVKKLEVSETLEARRNFEHEVTLISNIYHRNLLCLLGCCGKGPDLLLVYEYMEKGSLDHFLFGDKSGTLNWKQRFNVILGTARALAYLHEEFHICIIHRDIKPGNILLDIDFQPKVADFGLARLFPENRSHVSTRLAGTLGYAAPEYLINGQLSEKADTYSFGVVVLEIVSGRRSNDLTADAEDPYLLALAWNAYENEMLPDLVDKSLDMRKVSAEEVTKVTQIGLMCTQSAPLRPAMSEVVNLLMSKDSTNFQLRRPTFMHGPPNKTSTENSTTSGSSMSNASMTTSFISGR